MKFYFAGNTPHRVKEEKPLLKKRLVKRRVFSYFYFMTDPSLFEVYLLWKEWKNQNEEEV